MEENNKIKITGSPAFMKDLVVYEAAVKGFTSPEGPESGTFRSLTERFEYLQNLGITGIWLAGHQLCDPRHFYNIWTEYACIDPGRLDPSLGTEEDFRAMVEEAHRRGIRIFLDVITHGVMADSPLVKEHPDWFSGSSWGMTDFDWYGNHPDLDEWWVGIWTDYVTRFGVDGYRLDVAHYRNDLWGEIRRRCEEAGHEILIMPESGPAITGISDVLQCGLRLSDNHRRYMGSRILWDLGGNMRDTVSRASESYHYEIHYTDGEIQHSFQRPGDFERTGDSLQVFEEGKETVEREECGIAYLEQRKLVRLENVRPWKNIKDVAVFDEQGWGWHSNQEIGGSSDYYVEMKGSGGSLNIAFPFRHQAGQYISIQLSCHDNGWEGSPKNEDPYTARGSRWIMGYGCLLAPAVPLFMGGEEFWADYRPIPWHSPNLYGGEDPGQGTWLYGSWMQWDQLEKPHHEAMLRDCQRMLAIRKQFSHMIRPMQAEGADNPVIQTVSCISKNPLPRPYIYLGDQEAVLVAANPDSNRAAELCLDLTGIFGELSEKLRYEVLFGPEEKGDENLRELDRKVWRIQRDQIAEGGLLVIRFQWKSETA